MQLIEDIAEHAPEIAALRREIHAHPELNYEEVRTAALVVRQLEAWGIEVHRGIATTGVVGLVHGRDGGRSGRAVGLRADMDAPAKRRRDAILLQRIKHEKMASAACCRCAQRLAKTAERRLRSPSPRTPSCGSAPPRWAAPKA